MRLKKYKLNYTQRVRNSYQQGIFEQIILP
jgi:hypothetical protein